MRYNRTLSAISDRKGVIFGVLGALVVAVLIFLFLFGRALDDTDQKCKKAGFDNGADNIFSCAFDVEKSFSNISIVVGNTQNTPEPKLTKTAREYVRSSLAGQKQVDINIISTNPNNDKKSLSISENDIKSDSVEKYLAKLNSKMSEIDSAISSLPNSADGSKYLEAITFARSRMSSDENKGEEGLIIVIGSGLSDGGYLNFADSNETLSNGQLGSNIEKAIIDRNRDQLKDTKIIWLGIGETRFPQTPLGGTEFNNLKEIYKSLLKQLGCKEVYYLSDNDDSRESTKTEHIVKPVGVREVVITNNDYGEKSELGFKENEWTFTDEMKARELVSSIVNSIKNDTEINVYIYGYAAFYGSCNGNSRGESYSQTISYEALTENRAKAVEKLFLEYGFPKERIKSEGKGLGELNECVNGSLDFNLMEKNRIVNIITTRKERSI